MQIIHSFSSGKLKIGKKGQITIPKKFLISFFEHNPKSLSLIQELKIRKDTLIIPLTVFSEFIKKLMQKGISENKIDELLHIIESSEKIKISYPDKSIAKEAAKISSSHSMSLIDSFVDATAKLTECHTLLSADSDYNILARKKYIKIQSW